MAERKIVPGTVFKSKNKNGNEYRYMYVCKTSMPGGKDILLYCLDMDVYMSVEPEWVKQREIQILGTKDVTYYVLLRFQRMYHCWSAERYCRYIKRRKGAYDDIDNLLKVARSIRVFPASSEQKAFQKAKAFLEKHPSLTNGKTISKAISEVEDNA